MDALAIERAYDRLEDMGVDVMICPFAKAIAMVNPDGILAVNPARLRSGALEHAVLLHEEGHFATGTFYQLDSPYTLRQHQENVANRYVFEHYFPLERLLAAMDAGFTEPWQLAEYFDLPQSYVEEMLAYYAGARGVDFSAHGREDAG